MSCRREQDGGKFIGSEADRQLLLRTAILEGVDYIDLEEDIAAEIPRFGSTKRVISLHDFRQTPPDLESVHRRLAALDADLVKIATMSNQPEDNLRMLKLIEQADVPTVGICMGEMGIPTRVLAKKFGAPFTFATFHHERALAPGQLSFREMVDVYHYEELDSETQVFGVVADPVGHSLSPHVHNAAMRDAGLNAVYVPMRIPSDALEDFLEHAPQMGVRGISVTIPHKEAVLPMLTYSDNAVLGIGAANTVIFGDGTRSGYNTDYQAAMESLHEAIGGSTPFRGKTALLLGAGGAARAIAYGLALGGAEVVIASRTFSRARKLADRVEGKAVDWQHRHAQKPQIVVNCTPIGMHPNVDESPLDKHYLKPSMVVFDTVYNPENTLLVKYAREQSCRVVTGMEMFVRQAALQFKLFTGQEGSTERIREVVRRAIGPVNY